MGPFDAEGLRALTFRLAYIQHGGSGLGFTKTEIDGMELDEIRDYIERLDEEREREAKAVAAASKPKSSPR